jgi:predicted dienelactone hydrolase
MSWFSSVFGSALADFKRRAREWCRDPGAVEVILSHPAMAAWLGQQAPEVQAKVRVAIPLMLAAMADKWFGG